MHSESKTQISTAGIDCNHFSSVYCTTKRKTNFFTARYIENYCYTHGKLQGLIFITSLLRRHLNFYRTGLLDMRKKKSANLRNAIYNCTILILVYCVQFGGTKKFMLCILRMNVDNHYCENLLIFLRILNYSILTFLRNYFVFRLNSNTGSVHSGE